MFKQYCLKGYYSSKYSCIRKGEEGGVVEQINKIGTFHFLSAPSLLPTPYIWRATDLVKYWDCQKKFQRSQQNFKPLICKLQGH